MDTVNKFHERETDMKISLFYGDMEEFQRDIFLNEKIIIAQAKRLLDAT